RLGKPAPLAADELDILLFEARLRIPTTRAWLGYESGALVATAGVMQATADGRDVAGWAHLTGVAVTPSSWGRGLGREIVVAAQDGMRADGYAAAGLWTQQDNTRARTLYESLGWTATGRTQVSESGETQVRYEIRL